MRSRERGRRGGVAKDLAWDPTRGRLLVLHTGVYPDTRAPDVVNILAIEPVSGAVSLLGRVSGESLSPSHRHHSPEGLAVDSAAPRSRAGRAPGPRSYKISYVNQYHGRGSPDGPGAGEGGLALVQRGRPIQIVLGMGSSLYRGISAKPRER